MKILFLALWLHKMKLPMILLLAGIMCACYTSPAPCGQTKQETTPTAGPISPLDGLPNTPSSWHKGHVTVLGLEHYVLDDGSIVKFYFTGGTEPWELVGGTGEIYVSVPSYNHEDNDNTYYFQKFTPDSRAK